MAGLSLYYPSADYKKTSSIRSESSYPNDQDHITGSLKKAQLRDAQYKAYLNQQRDIKHQEAVIAKLKSFNREKSIKRAESREKMLLM